MFVKIKLLLILLSIGLVNPIFANTLEWLSQPEIDIGTVPDNETGEIKLSRNGRYVSFVSKASNLVSNDNNRVEDVFIKDMQTGDVKLVSITSDNIQPLTGRIDDISMPTSDGRFVAFTSDAFELPQANGEDSFIYLKDLQTDELVNVSNYGNNQYFDVVNGVLFLSNDGQFVIFSTSANIDPLHDNSRRQVYVKDLQNSTFDLLSTSLDGTEEAFSNVTLKSVSNTGRYVLLSTSSNNFSADVINNFGDNFFILDRQDNSRVLVNITPTGNCSTESNSSSSAAAISNSGQVVFMSEQTDLVNDDNNNRDDVFYFDNGTIIRINLDANGDELNTSSTANAVSLSGDGNLIVFAESSDELFPASTSDHGSLYSYETSNGTLSLLSKNASGLKVNNHSYDPQLSTNGNRAIFTSLATDLSNELVTGQHTALFHYNFSTDVMKNESQAFESPNTLIADARNSKSSNDMMSVIYSSESPNIVTEPIDDESTDLFLLDRNTNTNIKITSNVSTYDADISPSGNFIAFRSFYLPPDGTTSLGSFHIFLFDRTNNNYIQIAEGKDSKVNDDGIVVFTTSENIDANDTNGQNDIYAFDPSNQSITLVSKDMNGMASSANDMDIGLDNGDSWVTFSSDNENIVANDTNNSEDIFLKLMDGNSDILRVTETSSGLEGNNDSSSPGISDDGKYVVFITEADNLTSDDLTKAHYRQVMVFDRINHSFILASINEIGLPLSDAAVNGVDSASISSTGRYVSFAFEDRDHNATDNLFKNSGTFIADFTGDIDSELDVVLFDTSRLTSIIVSKHINGQHSDDKAQANPQVIEDVNSNPPIVGVLFTANGGDLTGLPSHPGHREIYLYQQENLNPDVIYKNGFE